MLKRFDSGKESSSENSRKILAGMLAAPIDLLTSNWSKMFLTSEAFADTSISKSEYTTSFCNPVKSPQLGMNTEEKNCREFVSQGIQAP